MGPFLHPDQTFPAGLPAHITSLTLNSRLYAPLSTLSLFTSLRMLQVPFDRYLEPYLPLLQSLTLSRLSLTRHYSTSAVAYHDGDTGNIYDPMAIRFSALLFVAQLFAIERHYWQTLELREVDWHSNEGWDAIAREMRAQCAKLGMRFERRRGTWTCIGRYDV